MLTGSKFLSGRGPNFKIKIMPIGSINSEIKTEFKSQGINQTVYRIFLKLSYEIKILLPYKSTSRTLESQILLVETAIVGEIPNTYYNLESATKEEALKLID